MKIIDLLNKIANGEEVPKKIKVGNKIYNYETFNIGKGDDYFTAEWEEVKGYRIDYDGTYSYLKIREYNLNDEVEIVEEEKKIPENNFNYIYSCEDEHIMANFENIKTTLKDIIDYLKSKGE